MKRTERAYAKINLTLEIRGLRPDGFHEIESVMQLTELADEITLTPIEGEELRLVSNVSYLPLDGKNICHKAATAFFKAFGIAPRGFAIEIKKRIPVAAGLGGGSADGAAVIRLLAKEFGITDRNALLEVAASVGSDVPFCLVGGTCLCRGRGELMEPRPGAPKPIYTVIAKNTSGLSTPEIYSLYDRLPEAPKGPGAEACLRALSTGDPAVLSQALFNGMEAVSVPKRPAIGKLKERMLELGAVGARMSGSGPSVFGLFATRQEAQECQRVLREEKVTAYWTKFLNKALL